MSETIKVKRCPGCGQTKPVTEFYYDSWTEKLKGHCKACEGVRMKEYYIKNRTNRLEYAEYYRTENKEETLTYSQKQYQDMRIKAMRKINPLLECSCGITDIDVLTIDHIHNDGIEDRGSAVVFRRILKMSTAEARKRFQLLCRNCNWKKWIESKRVSESKEV